MSLLVTALIVGWSLALTGVWMAWRYRRSRRLHARCVRLCHRIADELSRKQEPELVTKRVFRAVMEHTGASIGILTYRDDDKGQFRVVRVSGLPEGVLTPGTPLEDGMCGWGPGPIEVTGEPELIHRGLRESMRREAGIELDRRQNMICIPVAAPNKVCGLLQLVSGPGQSFQNSHIDDLAGVGFYLYAAIHNAYLIDTIRQQRDAAEALYEIGLDISRSLKLDEILHRAVRQGHALMGSTFSWFLEILPAEEPLALIRKATGSIPGPFAEGNRIRVTGAVAALLGAEANHEAVLQVDDLLELVTGDDPPSVPEDEAFCDPEALNHLLDAGIRGAVIVRVGERGKARGLLCGFSTEPGFFDSRQVDLFKRLANHVLIALTNADLHKRISGIAAIEERQRLSDELHDNMSQMINGVALEFHAIARLAGEHGQTETLTRRIDHIQELLKDAKARIRQSIFELRLPGDSDLWTNLKQFSERFEHWHDLSVRTELPEEALPLPLDRQREVIRVVQEALWNARRHSGSNQARLTGGLDPVNGRVTLEVSDGGAGAEASRLGSGQGIATMEARAGRLDGHLRIHNDTRDGLTIKLEFPVDAYH
ncbi:MAG: histidine kinase [Pseudomonadota bacterium]|nr:histidine kinase [Pseudomonadota bacterium]